MNRIRRYFALIPIVALALVIAACDVSTSDDSDDATDVETPETTTDVTEDTETDDATVEEEADATATIEETDDATVDDEVTPVEESQETDVSDDAVATEETDATDDSTDTAAGETDAEQILEQAADRASELETARFELDGSGYIEIDEIGEISLNDAEGQVERPDRAQISINVDAAIAEIPIELLSYDGEIYFTDPISGEWHTVPDDFQFNPRILFDEDEGLPALIRSVSEPELLDNNEEVEGREAYKIYGIISEETINAGTGGVFQAEGDVDFNVWIDTETYDVLRVLAEDPTEETDSVWEMRIFGHDEPVEIDSPS